MSVRAAGGTDHVRRGSIPADDERPGGSTQAENGAYLDTDATAWSIRAVLTQYNDSCKLATTADYDDERRVYDVTTSEAGHWHCYVELYHSAWCNHREGGRVPRRLFNS